MLGKEARYVGYRKKALITGITGQDGSYLAELLLEKGYEVHGIKRRSSSLNTARIDHMYQDPHENNIFLHLHYGDMTDSTNLIRLISEIQPDEIYNLAAQSHVQVSFETAEYTANVDALGTLRVLEAIRVLGFEKRCKFYQASTSEMFGLAKSNTPLTESSQFYPRSPYGVAKLYSHWITVNYREAYGIFACSGILFNHESSRRGETFVTQKIVEAGKRIAHGHEEILYLGNLDAIRDWGGLTEVGRTKLGKTLIAIDPKYFRPTEVPFLLGDSTKARNILKWKPTYDLDSLINEMLEPKSN